MNRKECLDRQHIVLTGRAPSDEHHSQAKFQPTIFPTLEETERPNF